MQCTDGLLYHKEILHASRAMGCASGQETKRSNEKIPLASVSVRRGSGLGKGSFRKIVEQAQFGRAMGLC